MIYYDSDDEEETGQTQNALHMQAQSASLVSSSHHPLERGKELDLQTPDSPDLPMADMDMGVNSSMENLAPRGRVGLSGTIV